MINKYFLGALGLFALPGLALAAYDDVSLTTDVVITAGGKNYTISASTAQISTLSVGADTFSITLLPNSSATIRSSDGTDIAYDDGTYLTSHECTPSTAALTFSRVGVSNTVTLTPTSNRCAGGGNGPTVSAPSGGGSTVVVPPVATPVVPATTTIITPPAVTPVNNAPVAPVLPEQASPRAQAVVSALFSRALSVGKTHADVKRLQVLLNSDPETQVAKFGVGSPGKETLYFGSATRAAVMKFQLKYDIAKKGGVGYGNFGPATRAKIAELFGDGIVAPAVLPKVTTKADIQALLDQVKALQELLRQMTQ